MHFLHGINVYMLIFPLVYFIVVGGLLDGCIVWVVMKIQRFTRAFWNALIANIISFLAGLIAWPYIFPTGFDFADLSIGSFVLLWLVTLSAEALILKLFNYHIAWSLVFGASALMNALSFSLLYCYFLIIN